MTILRLLQKIFRRDEFPDADRKVLEDDPELVELYGPSMILTAPSKKYGKDIQKIGIVDRKRLDKLKKSIRDGYLLSDNPRNSLDREGPEETHYLSDYSKPGEFYMFSKKITGPHRLNYRIYKPALEIDQKTGKTRYVKKVILDSCYDHETTEGNYLEDKNLRARKARKRKNSKSIMSKKK